MIGLGIGFGTTNSCIPIAVPGGEPTIVSAQFQLLGEPTPTFRSVLHFRHDPLRDEVRRSLVHVASVS